ncbi:hypothetical protein CSC74_16925 [Pseudoxanthomonas yeongjuensis]|nr:hypothetical protein CSC74_16925 [Pseudoxanthomonas yeongjuensis]
MPASRHDARITGIGKAGWSQETGKPCALIGLAMVGSAPETAVRKDGMSLFGVFQQTSEGASDGALME